MSSSAKTHLEWVVEIANRMRDPDAVKQVVLHPDNHNSEPLYHSPTWGGISLEGYSGLLLLFAELDRLLPNEKWDAIAHLYVLKIKNAIETEGIHLMPPSLFGGLAGVCFALHQASKGGSRYQRLINALNEHLLQKTVDHFLVPLKNNLANGLTSPMHLYDLIQGIVGVGIYSLSCVSNSQLLHFTEELLRVLIDFTKPIQVEGLWIPGWHVPSRYQHLEKDKPFYPLGNFNLGLSHGVTGILAFLSVAYLRGICVEGQKQAIEKIGAWIQNHQKEDGEIAFWPTVISFEEETATTMRRQRPFSGRDAWCYGTPGVARTLFLAGEALKNESLKTFALESFRCIFKRSREQWGLPGPTCCHGIAGLTLITLQMAKDTQENDLKERVHFLNELLLEFYRPEHPFGFKEYHPCLENGYAQLDQVGLLEGATGILLTLLSLENATSWWHAPFLVSHGK